MPIKYIKMYKNGSWEYIQEDRVNRFLEEGWTLSATQEKKSPVKRSKNKITANAQVTSTEVVEEEHVCDENCEHDSDWDLDEDWADSEESVIDDETAKKED
jgi:hypothetical protein